ncbi:MAG TPA: Fe-S cluster assembly protein IscX [Phototrophicaceae bacterium]|jgi:FeS assembly protein IscX|nr:Fe-S cluster assembly protein IscX [Phototrophicaceae bacterium]
MIKPVLPVEPAPLTWEATYEIALSLIAAHPDVDPDSIGLQQLLEMVLALPDFADDPVLVNDGILSDILREWYEERNGL